MAAIQGIINLEGQGLSSSDLKTRLTNVLSPYKIDKIDCLEDERLLFVCGQQYFTCEDEYTISPFYDKIRKIAFAADCMLDNRDELIPIIKDLIKDKDPSKLSDSEILYKTYLKLGLSFTDKVCGIFSAVIYHYDSDECYIFTDHTSTRTIHYAKRGNTIYFGTLLNSVKSCLEEDVALNDEWISLAHSLANPDMIFKPELSPYEGIYTVVAGHYVKLSRNGIKSVSYYNPAKTKLKLKLKSDAEYRDYFVNLFDKCVKSCLRSRAETGCTLSSGLDSTSVACMAAKHLAKDKRTLHSFTSVPLADYISTVKDDKYAIEDESFGPKIINNYYKNVEVNLVDCKGKTAFTDLKRTIKLTELPTKSLINYTWMSEIYDLASKSNCKVMLKGQYGNSTISNGKILSRVYQELTHFKFISATKQAKAFIKAKKISKKFFIKAFLKTYKSKFSIDLSAVDEHLLRSDLVEKYNIKDVLKKNYTREGGSYMDSKRQFARYVYDTSILQLLGLFDTHLSLIYGLVIRDPAKDKRMIDFVFNAPLSCMVNNGVERRMIRDYMRGIVPDEILDITNRRGLQSSDYVYRVNQVLNKSLKSELVKTLSNPNLGKYYDEKKLENLAQKIESSNELTGDEIQLILCAVSLCEFVNFNRA